MSVGLRAANKFLKEAEKIGYRVGWAAFQMRYDGNIYTVEFGLWADDNHIGIPSLKGKGQSKKFDDAVLIAIEKARGTSGFKHISVGQKDQESL